MLNFDADVKKTTARHQCENSLRLYLRFPISKLSLASSASAPGTLGEFEWEVEALWEIPIESFHPLCEERRSIEGLHGSARRLARIPED